MAVLVLTLVPVIMATGGVSTSTVGGLSLMMGTNQDHGGRYNQDDVDLYTTWGPDRERRATQEAITRIVSDPPGFAALTIRKSHNMWAQEYYGVQFALADAGAPKRDLAVARLLSQLVYAGVLVGAAAAAWRSRHQRPTLVVVVLAIFVGVAGLHVFAEVQNRFHAYLVPLFIVLAVASVARYVEEPSDLSRADSSSVRPKDRAIATAPNSR